MHTADLELFYCVCDDSSMMFPSCADVCCCSHPLAAGAPTAKIHFPAGTVSFILLCLILARQTLCEKYETSPFYLKHTQA